MKGLLSIRTVLLSMISAALLLPLSGLWVLRLYESALIRQTESELIAQGAVVASAYGAAWRDAGGRITIADPTVDPRWTRRPGFDPQWLPHPATLDLASDPVLPAAPEPQPAPHPAQEAARAAGHAVAPILRETQRVTLAGMRVVDRDGIVVASTGDTLGQSLAGQDEIRRALTGEPVSAMRLRGNGPAPSSVAFDRGRILRVFCALPVLEGDRVIGAVLLSRTPRTITEALAGKQKELGVLALLLLGAVAVLATVGTVTIAAPLRAVTRRAKRVAEGERGALENPGRPVLREVAELSDALTRMAATLEHRADYIRDFAAHVSHEFKTPLTTIRGTVELLREHLAEMSEAERDRFLSNMDAEAERLSRLVRRLLDLARADVMRPPEEKAGHPAAVAARLADRFRAGGMTVEIDGDHTLAVTMGDEALETVLGNLLDNARQHAGAQARVTLTLCDGGDMVDLTMADNGPGISAANAERIFTPFFTTARTQGGTGLGLAIVHSLVVAHGGTIAVLPCDHGAAFRLRLPRVGPPANAVRED
ncbi:MAG TPA: HAMP domain-containing sensor histidine kinase [Magnetospirillum sp.]|nr:HAMP domain-containing sensor histidine kinase [Magnetospirillum sp.]